MKDDKSLLYACAMNDLGLIKERLKNAKSAQLKKSTKETGTPLHAAALHGNKEAVDLLLAAGADIEAVDFLRDNAMHACIKARKLDIVRYLIGKGSDINKKGCQNRHALSQLICYAWDREFAEYLVSEGCDILQTSRDGYSMLNDAACSNNTDAIDFLLKNGIDKFNLNSALCWAILKNASEATRYLLDQGTSLEEMYAATKGLKKGLYHTVATKENGTNLIKLLIKHGVDFSKPSERAVVVGMDKTKLSPLEYAKAHFTKWPAAVYLAENIRVMEESTA
ncbi:Ribulose-5-phosphate 4-epimerase and related epimerases and aldolases [Serratia fonticola]|jgi:ankyrin repeat protein|uniref:ankyrin repeat domain-containing protein n=1 Tax=Serratia fonticola TaxID=47917 RepID=UPI002178EB0B|nr:ankyrin repeat domain-containing protein [Serratia fonticola]CAI1752203.1 Ribulose-5-phosphate 4-epimerase and related epimerases and aldolases [Serratia fonticola]